jgi:ribosomal protein L34E
LDNPAYAAFRVYDGDEFGCAWSPLVTRAVWDTCKAKRRASRTTLVDPPGNRTGLLSGILTCGLCGKNLHHGHQTDRDDIYRCMTGDNRPPRCLGGQIKADRAERLVTDAFFEAMKLAGDDITERWNDSSVAQRRDLFRAAIHTAVLLPKPPGNRHGRGIGTQRTLKIGWGPEVSTKVFGYIGATSTLTPNSSDITSPKGKTWAEWNRARMIPR